MKFKDLKKTLRPNEAIELSIDHGNDTYEIVIPNECIGVLDKAWFIPGVFDDYTVVSLCVDFLRGEKFENCKHGLRIIIRKDGT